MAMNENGAGGNGSWLSISWRKVPSMSTLAALAGMVITFGAWALKTNGDWVKLNDHVSWQDTRMAAQDSRAAAIETTDRDLAKLVDTDGRRIDALSFRLTSADDRATALTAAITALAAEFHSFVHEQDVSGRRVSDSLAEIKSMLGQLRTDMSWATRGTGPKPAVPAMPGER